jgi:hypothetical protein
MHVRHLRLTLSVHEVGDGYGVNAIDLGSLRVEDDVGTTGRAVGTKVLLAEVLNLLLDGGTLLFRQLAVCEDEEEVCNVRAAPQEGPC